MHSNDTTQEIPYGYCHCGCGQKTNIVKETQNSVGHIKGQPMRYVFGHYARTIALIVQEPNPSGLCMCGCGQATPLATDSSDRDNTMKGKPIRFIKGHNGSRSPEIRFWEKVKKSDTNDCWEWQSTTNNKGYGTISIKGRSRLAHRFSYEIHNGSIPNGLNVLHRCDNPLCCNPAHLFLGTQRDNIADMVAKGRNRNSTPVRP
jgi:hypothetical protein